MLMTHFWLGFTFENLRKVICKIHLKRANRYLGNIKQLDDARQKLIGLHYPLSCWLLHIFILLISCNLLLICMCMLIFKNDIGESFTHTISFHHRSEYFVLILLLQFR